MIVLNAVIQCSRIWSDLSVIYF